MPILTFQDEVFSCARAQKGGDFVRLLDSENNIVFFADGVTDFSGYVLTDGEWESPSAVVSPVVGALAALSGSEVVLTLPGSVKVETGLQVTFKAPCDCSVVSALVINGENYTVVDTLALCVTGKGGAWTTGAALSVILDVENKRAYLQNNAGVKIATGSYEGTGTYGANNPNLLQFEFVPKFVVISGIPGGSSYSRMIVLHINGNLGFSLYEKGYPSTVTVSASGCDVEWYDATAGSQLNETGATYNYVAIG